MIQTGRLHWPTLCRVCHRWQGQTICAGCILAAGLDTARCHRCAINVPFGQSLCRDCDDTPPTFDHAIAALDYALPWQGLITGLKFRQDTALAGTLSTLLAQAVRQRWDRPGQSPPSRRPLRAGAPTVVMPVPLSDTRLRERGYNQADLLATHLGRQLGLPVLHDALIRRRHTQRLMRLNADEREAHIRQAFAINPARLKHLKRRHVAVVDDVLTSGATLNEAARTLWLAGAHEVSVWVVARTPLPAGAATQACHPPDTHTGDDPWQATELMSG